MNTLLTNQRRRFHPYAKAGKKVERKVDDGSTKIVDVSGSKAQRLRKNMSEVDDKIIQNQIRRSFETFKTLKLNDKFHLQPLAHQLDSSPPPPLEAWTDSEEECKSRKTNGKSKLPDMSGDWLTPEQVDGLTATLRDGSPIKSGDAFATPQHSQPENEHLSKSTRKRDCFTESLGVPEKLCDCLGTPEDGLGVTTNGRISIPKDRVSKVRDKFFEPPEDVLEKRSEGFRLLEDGMPGKRGECFGSPGEDDERGKRGEYSGLTDDGALAKRGKYFGPLDGGVPEKLGTPFKFSTYERSNLAKIDENITSRQSKRDENERNESEILPPEFPERESKISPKKLVEPDENEIRLRKLEERATKIFQPIVDVKYKAKKFPAKIDGEIDASRCSRKFENIKMDPLLRAEYKDNKLHWFYYVEKMEKICALKDCKCGGNKVDQIERSANAEKTYSLSPPQSPQNAGEEMPTETAGKTVDEKVKNVETECQMSSCSDRVSSIRSRRALETPAGSPSPAPGPTPLELRRRSRRALMRRKILLCLLLIWVIAFCLQGNYLQNRAWKLCESLAQIAGQSCKPLKEYCGKFGFDL